MEAERVALFRDESHWTGWRQFHSAEHEQNTRDGGGHEVRDFEPVDSSLRSQLQREVERSLKLAQSGHAKCSALTVAAQEKKFATRLQRILNEQEGMDDGGN